MKALAPGCGGLVGSLLRDARSAPHRSEAAFFLPSADCLAEGWVMLMAAVPGQLSHTNTCGAFLGYSVVLL